MRSTYIDLLAKYGISGAHPGGLPLTKSLLDCLHINNNTKLLDLGCGTGDTLAYIAKKYTCEAVGVDINNQMLFKAAQRFKTENLDIDLFHADVMQLPFPSNTYDIALSESVTIFTDINKALKEYARILKDDGTLVAIEMTAEFPLSARELYEIQSVYGVKQVPYPEDWEWMLRQAGFAGIESHTVKMVPTLKFSSLKMLHDFSPHLSIMSRYGRKLGYRVYKGARYRKNM